MAKPKEPTERPLVAIVGADSLIGREIGELLDGTKPAPRVQLISASEDESVLSLKDDEPIVMTPLNAESLRGAKVAFLTGSPEASRRTLELTRKAGPALIDMHGALDELPAARLRAPQVEAAPPALPPGAIHVIAHPAAIALALFFSRLSRYPLRRSVVQIFEPASERGQQGIGELQKQTVNLLSFKPLPKDVFDAQLGFNLLARYGSESKHKLEDIELRIDRHLASLLAGFSGVPMPSLRLIQVPVFHGYSFSIWTEFAGAVTGPALAEALTSRDVDVRAGDEEVPDNVGIAGQSGIAVGAMTQDRNDPRAWWFWVVADNLRIAAENAMAVANDLL